MKIDLTNISASPGCYLFKNSAGKIIYVGKAKNLKKRVKSYFTKTPENEKTLNLIKNINSIDTIVTKNEIEALILENTLIKKHKPRYNIDLRDSKNFAYIELTNEEFPRFKVHRPTKNSKNKSLKNKSKLYGPFTSGKARDDILQIINRTFKLRTCKNLPKRACLRHSIGICSAPCIKKITKKDYNETIASAIKIIKGQTKEVIIELEEKMKKASKNLEFERAKDYRDQISSLNYLEEKQNVERKRKIDEDVINYIIKNDKVHLLLFNIYKGTLHNKQEFTFDYTDSAIEEFIVRHYSGNQIPKELIVPKRMDSTIQEFLTHKKGSKVIMTVPKQGEKKELLELVKKNIEIVFFGEIEKLETLRRLINLQETPYVIECFDISHLSGTNIVASMVQFRNAKPAHNNYRRYKLRTVTQNDDYASMREVVKRRYTKLKLNNEDFPDLILIDGGKGQLSSAIEILKELGIKIPIISLAKEFEEIYTPMSTESIKLDEKNPVRLLLERIRDEAHRFAISYNRLLRKKAIRG